jgi:hypothetical protein
MQETQIWLPVGRPPRTDPHNERDVLMRRLWEINVYVADVEEADIVELRDIVQWQEERHAQDVAKARLRPARQTSTMTMEQTVEYLHELIKFRNERRAGRKAHY